MPCVVKLLCAVRYATFMFLCMQQLPCVVQLRCSAAVCVMQLPCAMQHVTCLYAPAAAVCSPWFNCNCRVQCTCMPGPPSGDYRTELHKIISRALLQPRASQQPARVARSALVDFSSAPATVARAAQQGARRAELCMWLLLLALHAYTISSSGYLLHMHHSCSDSADCYYYRLLIC